MVACPAGWLCGLPERGWRQRPSSENSGPNADLDTELRHLRLADEHIARARKHIEELSALVASRIGERRQSDAVFAERLATLKHTLAAFEEHRGVIEDTIAGLRDGSLPGAWFAWLDPFGPWLRMA